MFWKEELDNSGLLVRDVCAECFRNSQEDMERKQIGSQRDQVTEEVRLLPGMREGLWSRCMMPR